MKTKNEANHKNNIIKEVEINISITDEHNEQELTSMGETRKSSRIISAINFPPINISFSNKNKLNIKHLELTNQKSDNYSIYTNIKKIISDKSVINDEIFLEVRQIL